MNQPLSRHPSLQPLSRHHHHALVMAQSLLRVQEEEVSNVVESLRAFWEPTGELHFHEEESVLLPAFAKHADVRRDEVIQMLLDHVEIRSQIQIILSRSENSAEALHRLGDHLQRHVRFEERVVFPLIQETVPSDELENLPDFA